MEGHVPSHQVKAVRLAGRQDHLSVISHRRGRAVVVEVLLVVGVFATSARILYDSIPVFLGEVFRGPLAHARRARKQTPDQYGLVLEEVPFKEYSAGEVASRRFLQRT